MEVSFEDGKYYMTHKSPDGSLYGDEASEYYGKKQFIENALKDAKAWRKQHP